MTPTRPTTPWLAYALLTLTSLFWSGNFVVARATHAAIPPMTLSFGRWLIALLILLPFAYQRVWADRSLYAENWRRIVLLGAIGVAGFNSLAYAGLQYTSATNAVLTNSFIPILILPLGALFLGEPFSRRQVLGVLVSFVGVMVIFSHGQLGRLLALELNQGDMILLLAALDWAVYTLLLRGLDPRLDRLGLLLLLVVVGLVCIAPLYVWEWQQGRTVAMTVGNLATFVYVGVFPSVLAYLFYNYGVQQVGPGKAGSFIHLMPVFGTLLAIAFLGERFEWFHAVGIAGIAAGLWLSSRRG
ncbi:DMT family transporter [Chitinimonas viridis]|uniref:DMT family transporter n=2 Tax=Chitinimonas TaxID=240411 RepID=A0ABT8B6J5_9NEIS|nr:MULTISPECIES: DMT family transporter [Chitinimonas]MDN3577639.1 DMT family transporter [Chitinimonas viridis]GLR15186.1 multidrug DMT transporter permease [Chitinimonas prasina]